MNEKQLREIMELTYLASDGTVPNRRVAVEQLQRTNLGWAHDGDGRRMGGAGGKSPTTHSVKISGFGWSLLVTDDNILARSIVHRLCEFLEAAMADEENTDDPMSEEDIQAGADAYRRAKARD